MIKSLPLKSCPIIEKSGNVKPAKYEMLINKQKRKNKAPAIQILLAKIWRSFGNFPIMMETKITLSMPKAISNIESVNKLNSPSGVTNMYRKSMVVENKCETIL
jgi:hypothetical protein